MPDQTSPITVREEIHGALALFSIGYLYQFRASVHNHWLRSICDEVVLYCAYALVVDPILRIASGLYAFSQARKHRKAGRLDIAEKIARRVVRHSPNDHDSIGLLGEVLFAKKEFTESFEYFSRATMLKPEAWSHWHNAGLCKSRLLEHSAAIDYFRRAIVVLPSSDQSTSELARSLYYDDYPELAIPNFAKAESLGRKTSTDFAIRSMSHSALGDFELALRNIEAANREKAETKIVFLAKIAYHSGRNDRVAACEIAEEATVKWPEVGHFHAILAMQQAIRGNVDEAKEALDRAQRIGIRDTQSLAVNYAIQFCLGNHEDALKTVSDLIGRGENRQFLYRAAMLAELGRNEAAIEDVKSAIAYRPRYGVTVAFDSRFKSLKGIPEFDQLVEDGQNYLRSLRPLT